MNPLRDLGTTAVIDPEVIANLPEPSNLIARWWAYVPPAIMIKMDGRFIRRNRHSSTDGLRMSIHAINVPGIERNFEVPYALFRATWQHWADTFDNIHVVRNTGLEIVGRLWMLFFDEDGEPFTIEKFIYDLENVQISSTAMMTTQRT